MRFAYFPSWMSSSKHLAEGGADWSLAKTIGQAAADAPPVCSERR